MRKQMIALVMAALLCLSACGSRTETPAEEENGRDVLFQVSLLQGLTRGDYEGSITAGELRQRGDIGIGTFDRLNGEMIMVDGEIFRAAADGSVEAVPDEETIPFSNVTFFDADETEALSNVESFDALREVLNRKEQELGENRFYMIRIDGTFKTMNVRSEYAQDEPYQPLADVLEHDQTFFDYENIEGTVVGLYCPSYMEDINAVGWHLHFVSKDRTKGGHVLGLSVDQADLSWDLTDSFQMILPGGSAFQRFDLSADQSEDIKKVETTVQENDG